MTFDEFVNWLDDDPRNWSRLSSAEISLRFNEAREEITRLRAQLSHQDQEFDLVRAGNSSRPIKPAKATTPKDDA